MRKLIVGLIMAAMLALSAAPSSASPVPCSTWACGTVDLVGGVYFVSYLDRTPDDGVCVRPWLYDRHTGERLAFGPRTCGPTVSITMPTGPLDEARNPTLGVRLYTDKGRFLTLN